MKNLKVVILLAGVIFVTRFAFADTSTDTVLDFSWSMPAGVSPSYSNSNSYQYSHDIGHGQGDGSWPYEYDSSGGSTIPYSQDGNGNWPVMTLPMNSAVTSSFVQNVFYLNSDGPTGGSGHLQSSATAIKPDNLLGEHAASDMYFTTGDFTYQPENDDSKYWVINLHLDPSVLNGHTGPLTSTEQFSNIGFRAGIYLYGGSQNFWAGEVYHYLPVEQLNQPVDLAFHINPFDPDFSYESYGNKFPGNFSPDEVRQYFWFDVESQATEYGPITATPEPVSCALFLIGAGALAGARKVRGKFIENFRRNLK